MPLSKGFWKRSFNVLIVIFAFFFLVSFVNALEISGCRSLNTSYYGQTLDLNSDILGFGPTSCFSLSASDDDNFLRIDCQGHTIDTNEDDGAFFNFNGKHLASVSFINCNINIGDGGVKLFNIANLDQEELDFNFQNTYIAFSDTGTTGLYFTNSDINQINIFDLNVWFNSRSGSFIYLDVSTDVNYVNALFSDELLFSRGYLIFESATQDSEQYFSFNDGNINFNSSAWANNGVGCYFSSAQVDTIRISDLNVVNYSSIDSEFFYVDGGSSDINHVILYLNQFNLSNNSASLFRANSVNDLDSFELDLDNGSNGVLNLEDGNLVVLQGSDFNNFSLRTGEVELNNAGFVSLVGESSIDELELENVDTNLIMENGAHYLGYFDTDVQEDDLSLMNANFDGNTIIKAVNSNVKNLIIRDLNNYNLIFDFNDANIIADQNDFGIEIVNSDLNYLQVNVANADFNSDGSSLITLNNSDANYLDLNVQNPIFDFGNFLELKNLDSNGLNVNFNNLEISVGNVIVVYDSNVNDLNVYNLYLADSDTVLQTNGAGEITNFRLYDSNLTFKSLFDLNAPFEGIVYNNYLVDNDWDNNNIIIRVGIQDENVELDFNVTLEQDVDVREVILTDDSSYYGGNYWLDENQEEVCTRDSLNPKGICDLDVNINNDNSRWVDYLPLVYYEAPVGDGDGDGDGDGGGGGGSSRQDQNVLDTNTNDLNVDNVKENTGDEEKSNEEENVNIENETKGETKEYVIVLDEELMLGETQIIYITDLNGNKQIELNVIIVDTNENETILVTDENGIVKYIPSVIGNYAVKVGNSKKIFTVLTNNEIENESKHKYNNLNLLMLIGFIVILLIGITLFYFLRRHK